MKKIVFLTIFVIISTFVYAEDNVLSGALKQTVDNVSKSVAESVTNRPATLPVVPTPDPFKDIYPTIKVNLKTTYQQDGAGTVFDNKLGIKLSQTLAGDWRADAYIEISKAINNGSDGVNLNLYEAKFEYVGTFFRVLFGRANLSGTISTLQYFGPYITSGQRYLDVIGFSLPIYLKAGVPEIEEIELPPIAISAYYLPAMLSKDYTTYFDRKEEYIIGQLRLNMSVANTPIVFTANLGKSSYSILYYSVLSGNLAWDASLSVDLAQHVKVVGAFGQMNVATGETAVAAAGLEVHDMKQWTFNLLDSLLFESQFSFSKEEIATFDPAPFSWFAVLKNNIARFRYFIAVGSVKNDFTLAAAKSIDPGMTAPFGDGNIYAPETLILRNDGLHTSIVAGVGYEF
jgi:hypothetical protein